MDEFLNGLGIAAGVFVGVVGGTAVTLGVGWFNQKRGERQKLANLKFELALDIKKLDTWLTYVIDWRNAVNANAPARIVQYFDLSRMVFISANDMWASGLLYAYLDHDDMGTLQTLAGDFTLNTENYLNNQITQQQLQFNQQQPVAQIDFWENKFKAHRKTLQAILAKLH